MTDAEAWGREYLFDEVDYRGLPLSVANQMHNTFKSLDVTRGLLKHLTFVSHAIAAYYGATADYRHIMTTYSDGGPAIAMSFNERYFVTPDILYQTLRVNRESGHSTIEGLADLLTHEYGHVMAH